MQLIKEANKFYKMWSVQLMTLVLALEVFSHSWSQYSEFVPEPYHGYVQGVLTVVAIIARLIRQKSLSDARP